MPLQLSLSGVGSPRATDGLFFGVMPNGVTAARSSRLALALKREHGLEGRPMAPERLHVTLVYFGMIGLPADVVAAMTRVGRVVGAVLAPFDVRFDRVMSFRGTRRPLVLAGGGGLAALRQFHHGLRVAMRLSRADRATPHYTPHMTLMRADRGIAEQAIEPIEWAVHEFVLVHSLIGLSKYEVLARFPLRGTDSVLPGQDSPGDAPVLN